MDEINLIGEKQDLIDIIESHIAYLLASGYDNGDNPYYSNPELNICYNFLTQLDERSKFLHSSKEQSKKSDEIVYTCDICPHKNLMCCHNCPNF